MKRLCTLFAALLLVACNRSSERAERGGDAATEAAGGGHELVDHLDGGEHRKIRTEEALALAEVINVKSTEFDDEARRLADEKSYPADQWFDLFERWGEWEYLILDEIATFHEFPTMENQLMELFEIAAKQKALSEQREKACILRSRFYGSGEETP